MQVSYKKLPLVTVGGFLFFMVLSGSRAAAATIVNENITTDTTWTVSGSPYILTKNNILQDPVVRGAKLTVEAGTVIKVKSSFGVSNSGEIKVLGTKARPVIITSFQDDILGDSNEDGSQTSGSPGQWQEFIAIQSGAINMTHTELRYGGNKMMNASSNARITLNNVYLHHAQNALINVINSTVNIENSRFEDAQEGLINNGTAEVKIRNSSFQNITGYAVRNSQTSLPVKRVYALSNYWGHPNGPLFGNGARLSGQQRVTSLVDYQSFLTENPICTSNCYSNVMFFPGIMGSKLYADGEELWLSSTESKQEKLKMNNDGTSRHDVYTFDDTQKIPGEGEERGLVESTYGFALYDSFLESLHTWKTEGIYKDYAFIPYDWRLGLDGIVMNGKVTEGKLRYTQENQNLQDSYLYQKLKTLQQNSKSGKVTLIGHSNGGLVIKALVQKLQDENDPLHNQIDKVILVAVPQLGTPDAIVSMLYGSRLGVLWLGVSPEMSRSMAYSMPAMYNLLPSQKLYSGNKDYIELQGDGVEASWKNRFGDKINSFDELQDFLKGADGRARPDYDDDHSPEVLSSAFLDQANNVHVQLDNWTPAAETQVIQIAGWGLYTPDGIRVASRKTCTPKVVKNRLECSLKKIENVIEDKFILNGDGTVVVSSALATNIDDSLKNYWVDIAKYNTAEASSLLTERKHKDITEITYLKFFIKSEILNQDIMYEYISSTEPSSTGNEYTEYRVHSPLNLTVKDDEGNIAGYNPASGNTGEAITGSQYFEIGESKTVLVPSNVEHTVTMEAYADGSFSFVQENLDGEEVVATTAIEAVPVLEGTKVDVTPASKDSSLILDIDFEDEDILDTSAEVEFGETEEFVALAPAEVKKNISIHLDSAEKELAFDVENGKAELDDDRKNIIVYDDNEEEIFRLPLILYKDTAKELQYAFSSIVYPDRTENFSRILVQYKYRKGATPLKTSINFHKQRTVKAESRSRREYTKIENKLKNKKVQKIKKKGYIIPSLRINEDKITIEY